MTARPLILVLFGEALSAPEVLFSLYHAGFRLKIAYRSGAPNRLARAMKVETVRLTPPEKDAGRAREDLAAAARGVDALFALDDVSLRLAADIAERVPGLVHIHATGKQAELALDKTRQLRAAAAAGLEIPDAWVVRGPAEFPADPDLPALAKPALAVQEAGGRIVKGDPAYYIEPEEYRRAAEAPDLPYPMIVQTMVRGTGEGVFGHATPDGVVQWSGHRRLRMMNPHGSGSSACEVRDPEPELRRRIERMMMAADWRGPFMVELLRDEAGTPWFMELNGRVWGSMALARRNGFDYPAWAAEAAFDPAFRPVRGPERRRQVRHLGREILHLMFQIRGPKTAFHRRDWPRLGPSLAGVLRPHAPGGFYNFDRKFPLFFVQDAWDTVARVVRRRT